MKCHRNFIKPWLGGAFVMGTKCPLCDGVGIANEEKTWEDGTLKIEDEEES
jgi:hypothetical protein